MRLENATPFETELTAAFERTGHESVIVVAKATFVLPDRPGAACLMAPKQEALFLSDVFGADPAGDAPLYENDFAPFKPACDVLVSSQAVAPESRPVTELPVGVRLGDWSKHFLALGSRIWLKGALGFQVSERRPFLRQAIGYDQAYGGTVPIPETPGHARTYETNPAGVGYYPLRENIAGLALPQTAEPGTDPVGRDGGYTPMAFGPLGRNWLPRRQWAGTYDNAWLETQMPFLPEDFDYRYFQAAPPDQWISYPKGGEALEVVHLSSTPRIRTRIPAVAVIVTFAWKSGRITQKIANLDTVLIIAESMRLCLTWRTRLVVERDIFEVSSIDVTLRGELPPSAAEEGR